MKVDCKVCRSRYYVNRILRSSIFRQILARTQTKFMFIGPRQRLSTMTVSPTFAINDILVTKVSTAKSLRVIVDDNLDWGSHVENIIKKVSSGIGAIKRVRHLIP